MFPTDMSACHYMEDHIKATRDRGSGGKENWKTKRKKKTGRWKRSYSNKLLELKRWSDSVHNRGGDTLIFSSGGYVHHQLTLLSRDICTDYILYIQFHLYYWIFTEAIQGRYLAQGLQRQCPTCKSNLHAHRHKLSSLHYTKFQAQPPNVLMQNWGQTDPHYLCIGLTCWLTGKEGVVG